MFRNIRFASLVVLSLAVTASFWPATAHAQGHRGRVVVGGGAYYSPFWYDPFYGPWSPYPYGYYQAIAGPDSAVRVLVTPKQAGVYVDGYYAGTVDDFDGFFHRLHVTPGGHTITLHLEGYRTVTRQLELTPNATLKLRDTMEKLAAGETSEAPPAPSMPPPATAGTPLPPLAPPAGMPPRMPLPPVPSSSGPVQGSTFGTLVIRVQPTGADVLIDGNRWSGPEGDDRLLVQVSDGAHHIEVRRSGYRPFAADVQIHRGETTPLNVSLPPEGR
jgi:hypothetical protein